MLFKRIPLYSIAYEIWYFAHIFRKKTPPIEHFNVNKLMYRPKEIIFAYSELYFYLKYFIIL